MFAGTAGVSRALRRKGYDVFSFDILQGEAGDLLRPPVLKRIFTLLSSGRCLGLFAGVECTTFSQANTEGLRSYAYPLGVPGLDARLQQKVEYGNSLLFVAARIFRTCKKFKVPFVWENPHSSRMWDTPQAQEIYEWPDTSDVVTDMCAWGTPWRKRTRFRTWLLPQAADWQVLCRPQGPSKACLFRGVPHVILRGKDAHGRSLTKRAAEYPPSLCRAIAAAMIDQGFQLSFGAVAKTSHLRVRK